MTFEIKLSEASKKKLRQLGEAEMSHFTPTEFSEWLSEAKGGSYSKDKKKKFIWESLKPLLSYDLKAHLKKKDPDLKKKKKTSWWSYLKFGGLLVAGTIIEGIEGFNGIAAVLGMISETIFAIPGFVSVIVGALFSLVSISVFYAFELTQIAKYFGISIGKARGLLDIYVEQMDLIREIQLEIGLKIIDADLSELEDYKALLATIDEQYKEINTARDAFNKQLNRPMMKVAKVATAITAGILYASGGFFSGSALGISLFSLIMGTAVTATFPPVIILAVVIAVAAFCIYWYVERPSLQNLIGRVMGLDKEKIDELADKKAMKADRKSQVNLNNSIEMKEILLRQELQLSEKSKPLKPEESVDSGTILDVSPNNPPSVMTCSIFKYKPESEQGEGKGCDTGAELPVSDSPSLI